MDQKSFSKQFPKNRNPNQHSVHFYFVNLYPLLPVLVSTETEKNTNNNKLHVLDLPSPPRNGNMTNKKKDFSRLKTQQNPLKTGPFLIINTSSNRSKKKSGGFYLLFAFSVVLSVYTSCISKELNLQHTFWRHHLSQWGFPTPETWTNASPENGWKLLSWDVPLEKGLIFRWTSR